MQVNSNLIWRHDVTLNSVPGNKQQGRTQGWQGRQCAGTGTVAHTLPQGLTAGHWVPCTSRLGKLEATSPKSGWLCLVNSLWH